MSDARTTRQLVVFSLGDEEYALPIAQVHEIIRYREPRAVASDLDWVRGVIGLRGKIVPVYDLAARLGVVSERTDSAKIVIVETASDLAGVVVDEVEEVLTVEASQLEHVPAASGETIEAVAKVGDRLVILLNPAGIFAPGTTAPAAPAAPDAAPGATADGVAGLASA